MMLTNIKPSASGFVLRTFKCDVCNHAEKVAVETNAIDGGLADCGPRIGGVQHARSSRVQILKHVSTSQGCLGLTLIVIPAIFGIVKGLGSRKTFPASKCCHPSPLQPQAKRDTSATLVSLASFADFFVFL